MWPNPQFYPQFPADLVTFNEEILNGKLNFLCSAVSLFAVLTKDIYGVQMSSFFDKVPCLLLIFENSSLVFKFMAISSMLLSNRGVCTHF